MQLEIISRYPETEAKSLPLLFIHGSFSNAEIWDENFLPYFAERGYESHALSLRGHGASEGHERLHWWGLADYVADLSQAIGVLERAPVLIGHSMGGMVAQKYLESARTPGAVLMASVPPQGLFAPSLAMAMRDPLLLQQISLIQSFGGRFASPRVMRRALFSQTMPEPQVRRYFQQMQGESQRVVMDMMGLDPLRLNGDLGIPVLVMGAGRDAFFTPDLVRDTARFYGTEAHIFTDMAHAMMLEPGWDSVAERLHQWLESLAESA